MNSEHYCLPAAYRSRKANNSGLFPSDHAQLCIYQAARRIADADPEVRTVLDWGCGSGFKTIEYFGNYDTLGVDVDYRLPILQERYPDRRWGVVPVPADADLILCVDVIEHLDDPVGLLQHFAAGTWRHLVISTPERDLISRHKFSKSPRKRRANLAGPPNNPWHAREWTAKEFRALLRRELQVEPQIAILRRYNLVAVCSRAGGKNG